MAEVKLQNIVKKFGNVEVVKTLSLNINDGEFLVLVGGSGCGKSTTLRMIAGLETIDSGEIYIGNRVVNNLEPKERNIAMVFQNYALYPHMNIYENIAFGLKLRRLEKTEIDKRVNKASDMLGIVPYLKRKPKELSGGQRQRVALARALVREPAVFLMDEPLSNLDAKLRAQTRTELKKIHQKLKTTTVYVTHDQIEAMTMGDRIAVMKDGIIQQLAAPKQIYDFPENMFVAGFIGSPSMNFLKVKIVDVENNSFGVKSEGFYLKLPVGNQKDVIASYKDKEVILGIRPEYITLPEEGQNIENKQIDTNIDVIEPSGSRTYMHVSIGGHSLVTEMDTSLIEGLKVNNQLKLAVDTTRLHIFDPATEKTVISTQAVAG